MNRSRTAIFLIRGIAILLCLGGVPASAFDSFPGGKYHKKITHEAMEGFGCSKAAIKVTARSNYRQDKKEVKVDLIRGLIPGGKALIHPNKRYRPEHHFDRNAGQTHVEAFRRGVSYLHEERDLILELIAKTHDEEALKALGRALHALQDFFSHSNYVDLSHEDQQKALLHLKLGAGNADVEIRITGYDRKTGKDLKSDTYGHGAFSKDSPKKNRETRKVLSDGSTKFRKAYASAVEASTRFLSSLKHAAGEEDWKRITSFRSEI